MSRHVERIIELQKALKIARMALEKIKYGTPSRAPFIAEDALDQMWSLENTQPLQELVKRERRSRP